MQQEKTQVSPYDPAKFGIFSFLCPEDEHISNCGQTFEKTVSFDDILHLLDEENIVTYVDFDCGINFCPETPTKINHINRKQIYVSRSTEKPYCIPSSDEHNCSIDKQHSSNILLNLYNLWDMVPAAAM